MIMMMQMRPSIAPINRFKHLAFTPTALNSGAQRRVAHAGSPTLQFILDWPSENELTFYLAVTA